MNHHSRNSFIARHEDDALNAYLDREQPCHCEKCGCYEPDLSICEDCEARMKKEADNG